MDDPSKDPLDESALKKYDGLATDFDKRFESVCGKLASNPSIR